MISVRHSHPSGRWVQGLVTGLVLIVAALPLPWINPARAQTMVTPAEAAELVQTQPVAGDQTDASELEAAAASAVQFDPLSPQVYGPGTIEQIIVRGNQRLSSSTILSILPVRVGQDFEPIRLDNALKSLYATGQFADVRIDRSGKVLIIQVRENVLINMVNFEGNGALSDDELTELIETTSRSVLSRTQVAEDIRAMKERYEILGRLLVVIEPKIIPLTGNRANLVFEINEGARTRIDAVNFVGNQEYNDRRLRSVILSKQSNIFRNLLQADGYSPGRVQVDKNFLTEYYQSRGFADFEVISARNALSAHSGKRQAEQMRADSGACDEDDFHVVRH